MQVFKDIKVQALLDITYNDVVNWINCCNDKEQLFELRHCVNKRIYRIALKNEPEYPDDDFRSRA